MRFNGTAEFVAGRARVWKLLADPTKLGPCVPVPIERVDDRHYRAQMRLGSGFFSTTVKIELEVTDLVEGESGTITGRGGASGTTIEGSATFEIRDGSMEGTTVVNWEVEFRLSGMFAGQAGRVIEEHAQEAIERLLTCVHEQIDM